MAAATTPTNLITILDAVNAMLRSVGRVSVATLLTADLSEDAARALEILGQIAVQVQSEGWHFNTEKQYPIDPGTDGSITLPANAHKVVMAGTTKGLNLAQRGLKLYDLDNHTFTIGKTIYADITFVFAFEDLPQPIRWYVAVKAARVFATGKIPTSASYQFTKNDEDEAQLLAKQFDDETEDRGLPEANPHFQRMQRR